MAQPRLPFCTAVLVLCTGAAYAQTPVQTRDARPSAMMLPDVTGTGSISGSVTLAGGGQPARKARVTLSAAEVRGSRAALTDDQGRFSFTALPPGRYTLSASKAGHVTVTYGQRQPGAGRPGTPIQLGDGQKFDARLQMPRGGVLTGTILDEHAEPTPGTPVRAMRYAFQSGQRTLVSAGSGTTDDRGMYRIYGLQPGEYVICATPRNNPIVADAESLRMEVEMLRQRAQAMAVTDATQSQEMIQRAATLQSQIPVTAPQTGYAPVCYPGTTATANAGTVAIAPAEERANVDFQLQLVPIGTVEGTVMSSSGALPNSVQVTLIGTGATLPGLGTSSTRVNPDGRFRIANVTPGDYTLFARGTIPPQRPATPQPPTPQPPGSQRQESTLVWAMAPVSVDGRTPASVLLSLQPGMAVSGQLAFEGTLPPPADMTRLRVSLDPVTEPGAAREISVPSAGRVDASGRFVIPSAVPGRYRFVASGGTGWSVESALVGGQDALDFPFEIKPNQAVSGAVITFTDRQAELAGTISDSRGEPATAYTVIAFAADRRYWVPGTRRLSTARPATDGRFIFRNLPPGEYKLATVIDPEPGAWTDPAYLQELDSASIRVTLAAGEKKVQNIRLSAQ